MRSAGFSDDSARNAARTRQASDPRAVVIPMPRSTVFCERAGTPNTKIVVVLHTTGPSTLRRRSTRIPCLRVMNSV